MKRRSPSYRWVPWRDAYWAVFTLAGEDWTPPREVKTTLNGRMDRLTWEGRFEQPDGTPVRLTVVAAREGDSWYSIKRKLDLRLTFGRAQ